MKRQYNWKILHLWTALGNRSIQEQALGTHIGHIMKKNKTKKKKKKKKKKNKPTTTTKNKQSKKKKKKKKKKI